MSRALRRRMEREIEALMPNAGVGYGWRLTARGKRIWTDSELATFGEKMPPFGAYRVREPSRPFDCEEQEAISDAVKVRAGIAHGEEG